MQHPTNNSIGLLLLTTTYHREVLMRHLDEEVADLQGENLKKYWTLEEVDKIAI